MSYRTLLVWLYWFVHEKTAEYRIIFICVLLYRDLAAAPCSDLHYNGFYQLMFLTTVQGPIISTRFYCGQQYHESRQFMFPTIIRDASCARFSFISKTTIYPPKSRFKLFRFYVLYCLLWNWILLWIFYLHS